MVDQQTLDAFEQMWGPFPEPVMLIHKNRTILATNEFLRALGTPVGAKCFSVNPEADRAVCKQCKANLALREQRTVCAEDTQNGKRIISYWMPLKNEPEVYVHFGIGCAEAMGIKPEPPSSHTNLVDVAV